MKPSDSLLINDLQSFVENIPFAKGMGFRVLEARKGYVEVRLDPLPELFNHFGTYQAGVYFTLGEITGGLLCGTFLDLSQNLLVTKKSEFHFGGATSGILISSAELSPSDVEGLLNRLNEKRKTTADIHVLIKSPDGEIIARNRNEYYLRLGIPKSFSRTS